MPERAFDVKYDGPGIVDGRIPVRDLAPSLLALGELFTEASKLIHPTKAPVSLEITATRDGSFVVDLILQAPDGIWDQIVDMFGSKEVTALDSLITLVLGSSGIKGLIDLRKWLKGRRITKQEPGTEPGTIKIVLDDESSLEIPSEVLSLNDNVRVRKSTREVVEPLNHDGIERLEISKEAEIVVSIERGDVKSFDLDDLEPPELPDIEPQEIEAVVEVASSSFTEGHKWRLKMGESTFYAAIADQGFLARVRDRDDLFGTGDRLRCQLQIAQTNEHGTEYTVLEVLDHIAGERQLHLPSGDESEAA